MSCCGECQTLIVTLPSVGIAQLSSIRQFCTLVKLSLVLSESLLDSDTL